MCTRRSTFIKDLLELFHVGKIVNKAAILLIFESSLDFSVALSEEHDTFLFTRLVIILLDHIEFLLHLFFEIIGILSTYFSNSYFIEVIQSLLLTVSVDIIQLLIVEGTTTLQFISQRFLEDIEGVVLSFQALVLADVSPRRFNAWNRTLVNSFDVALHEVPEHSTIECLTIDLFWLDPLENFPPEDEHLLNELSSKFFHRNVYQVLKFVLIGKRSDHGDAVTICKETL